jgi:hypothetical protein
MAARRLLLLLCLSSGCMSVKYSASNAIAHGARSGDVHHDWQHSLFLGLIPVSAVNLDQYCPDTGVLHVRSSVGPLGALATVFTLGVWTPSHVRVTCADWPVAWAPEPPPAVPAGAPETVVIVTEDGTRVTVERP